MIKGKDDYKKIRDYCDVHVPDLGLEIEELGKLICIISTYVNGQIIIYQYKMLVDIYCKIIN